MFSPCDLKARIAPERAHLPITGMPRSLQIFRADSFQEPLPDILVVRQLTFSRLLSCGVHTGDFLDPAVPPLVDTLYHGSEFVHGESILSNDASRERRRKTLRP